MDRKQRAVEAERILGSPLFQETFETMRDALLKEWETTNPEDTATREDAWRCVKMLSKVKDQFQKHARMAKLDENIAQING